MKKRKVFIFIAIIITVIPSTVSGWTKTYGGYLHDWGKCVQATSDGGYIVCGYTDSYGTDNPGASSNVWLLKTNSEGDTTWTKVYGYGTGYDDATHVEQTSDGGYIVVGKTDYGAGSGRAGEVWLLKTDGSGDTLWTRTFDFSSWGEYGYWVQETSDGGYILTGQIGVYGGIPEKDIFIIEVDSTGNTEWEKVYGGPEGDGAFCVVEIEASEIDFPGYLVSGQTDTEGNGGLWLLRTDEYGDTVWTKTYDLTFGYRILIVPGGYVIIGTVHHLAPYSSDVFILKTDFQGNEQWLKTYGGEGYDWGYDGEITPDGGFIVVATTESFAHDPSGTGLDVWLLKTDSLGDTLWTKFYGENWVTASLSIDITEDKGYIMTGITWDANEIETELKDLWLMKVDSLGGDGPGITEEQPGPKSNWLVLSSIGSEIVLRYQEDYPQGFHADVYNAAGRKVDEISTIQSSGIISWGECYGPGVYFIRDVSNHPATHKVVLVR